MEISKKRGPYANNAAPYYVLSVNGEYFCSTKSKERGVEIAKRWNAFEPHSPNPPDKPIEVTCMNCTAKSTVTDKDQPCPVCALCGSLAWLDEEDLK